MSVVRKYIEGVGRVLFPRICYACQQYEPLHGHLLCNKCLKQLPWIPTQPIAEAALEGKEHFPRDVSFFDSLLYFTKHSKVQHLIKQIKYNGQRSLAWYLGQRLGQKLKNLELDWSQYEIVPVPIHRKRKRQRGYNQAM